MKGRRSATVTLTGNDACVIFKEDGSVELVCSDKMNGERLKPNVVVMMGVAEHLLDVEFCEDMIDYMVGAVNNKDCNCPKCRFTKDVAPGGAVH